MQNSERFPTPAEYHTYLVCERLGKFPSEVEAQPFKDIQQLLLCMAVEAEVREANIKS